MQAGHGSRGRTLAIIGECLRHQTAAMRNSALQGNGDEIGASRAFALSPGNQIGGDSPGGGPSNVEQFEIHSDGFEATIVVAGFRAKPGELQEAAEFLPAHMPITDAGNLSNLLREWDSDGSRNQGAAIRDEELKQSHDGQPEDECGDHRELCAMRGVPRETREVEMRAFSGTRRIE